MPLKAGQAMPAFRGTLHDGTSWGGDDHRDGPLVVYFYPRDFTRVCTAQACGFRDLYDGLRSEFGAELVGVSRDSAERHARFRDEHRLPFRLLADVDGSIAAAFGVERLWGLIPLVKRVTFVADVGRTLKGVFHHELDAARHLREVRDCLAGLTSARRPPPRP